MVGTAGREAAVKIDGGDLFARMLEREGGRTSSPPPDSHIDGIDRRRAEFELNSFDYPLFKLEKQ